MRSDPYIPCDCLPGLLDGWCGPVEWSGDDGATWRRGVWGEFGPSSGAAQHYGVVGARDVRDMLIRLDLRREECRDRAARVLARVLGVPVGATAPGWHCTGLCEWSMRVPLPRGQYAGSPPLALTERRFVREPPNDYIASRYPGLHVVVPLLAPFVEIRPDSPDRDALALAAVARHIGAEIRAGRIQPAEVKP